MSKRGIITTSRERIAACELVPREELCTRTAWCVLRQTHGGPCLEVHREAHAPPDFGPKRKR